MIDAFIFELSKCAKPAIRSRMVAVLRNVDQDLARSVVDGLGLAELTAAAEEAKVNVELVASAVGGVEASDGHRVSADAVVAASRRIRQPSRARTCLATSGAN